MFWSVSHWFEGKISKNRWELENSFQSGQDREQLEIAMQITNFKLPQMCEIEVNKKKKLLQKFLWEK
jgi:hypothetical protein